MNFGQRLETIRDTMRENDWDLVVCARPMNVLMLSGYWPIVGTGVVCVGREADVRLLVPEHEADLAQQGRADQVATFQPASLKELKPASRMIEEPLRRMVSGPVRRVACEVGEFSEPRSYVGMHFYAGDLPELLKRVFADAIVESADRALANWRAVKTEGEIERIRAACQTAERAFEEGVRQLGPGLEEKQAAQYFMNLLGHSSAERAGGWVSCMSGPNSGRAYGSFARSSHRKIQNRDLVLTHCNSYEDGYWTDITRTCVIGQPDGRQREMREAIMAAREAALAAIAPGAPARMVDAAARQAIAVRGFGQEFRHPTGHGVGFEAITPDAFPRIHPQSPDIFEEGMVCNVEPGIYFPDWGGARHCDMVAVTSSGVEVLTPFQTVLRVIA